MEHSFFHIFLSRLTLFCEIELMHDYICVSVIDVDMGEAVGTGSPKAAASDPIEQMIRTALSLQPTSNTCDLDTVSVSITCCFFCLINQSSIQLDIYIVRCSR